MSEQDPKEHLKTYERFCAPRFKNVEDKVDSIDGKVDSIDRVVNNGLCDRMEKVEKTTGWLLKLLIGILITIVLSSGALFFTTMQQLAKHESAIERIFEDGKVSN